MRLLAVAVAALAIAPPPIAADFHVTRSGGLVPGPCRSAPVARRVTGMLRALAEGRPDDFARGFAVTGLFAPYGGHEEVVGRAKIAALLRRQPHEVWSAQSLVGPSGVENRPATGIYQLRVDVFHRGRLTRGHAAKIVIACSSGLVRVWVGPNVKE